jgi:hypothetical protein
MLSARNENGFARPKILILAIVAATAAFWLATHPHKSAKALTVKPHTETASSQVTSEQELSKFSEKLKKPQFQKYALNEDDLKLLKEKGLLTSKNKDALRLVSKN